MSAIRFLLVLTLVLAPLAILGCDSATTSTPSTPVEEPGATSQITSGLQGVAETGEIDSGVMMVREQLEELKQTDAAKAEELLKDLDELESLSGEAAKTKAKEMLEKL